MVPIGSGLAFFGGLESANEPRRQQSRGKQHICSTEPVKKKPVAVSRAPWVLGGGGVVIVRFTPSMGKDFAAKPHRRDALSHRRKC
ncbi:SORF5 protein [Gallid alphaherpesvirus 3]|uniref:SORF5 protein n=1 Tax=Gallid alphaherpesvirus 3 TaxID=35250 RepID=F8TC92_9ALPH|nr:SORF5 protein [Gallid alphaherpesvirus 3]AEI00303.1 SORF5 protein [Gallid alphaherpesvirus 3]QEY02319.1 SORF5 protein [Gallid alphaherpesvirus 3]